MGTVIKVIRNLVISWIIKIFTSNDAVRYASLLLVANGIYEKKVPGCVAELGVYKGDFAKRINTCFPDRKLFLFDTFEGFDERDVNAELAQNFSKAVAASDFTNTSVEVVLGKMKYRENCIVKKGYFPETTKGVEEQFAFVSIDADLYEPIYQGLKYFYPRLEKGGYIFVHDCNGDVYGGKAAVEKYANEFNIPYFPLCDVCATIVLSK
jgi:O-methyltransferase